MLKIFVTGDNHIGKKYERYSNIKEKLIQSRFDAMRDMIRQAEKEGCGIFVITGDLFDNISNIRVTDIKQVVEILSEFSGTVLVLPGNHDYYTGEEKVWKDFKKALHNQDHNIILLTEWREYSLEVGDEKAVVYPAFCQSKYSEKNNLAWIRETDIPNNDAYHIGIAHGAIEGLTPDMKKEYFFMTLKELNDIPVDVWLIGHTHIPYPRDLKENEESKVYSIFNAGTHEQLDLHNDTEGCCFIITLEKDGGKTKVLAHKYISGRVRYHDLELVVGAEGADSLENGLKSLTANISGNSIVRVKISGVVESEEYEKREKIYQNVLERFLAYEYEDDDLSEKITVDNIRREFPEVGFVAEFLEKLQDNPVELQMAYELVRSCVK